MLAGVLVMGNAAVRFAGSWQEALAGFMSFGNNASWEASTQQPTTRALMRLGLSVLSPAAWLAAAGAGAALLAGVAQTGGVQVHPQRTGFKADRMNPVSNLKNLASLRSAARLGKSLVPAALLAMIAIHSVSRLIAMPAFSTVRLTDCLRMVYDLLLACAWTMLAWAAIDYTVEWRSREQRLRMSKQEMREEFKESEGNPQIRARIRNLQRLARKRKLNADIARAAVVVTNPTHYAVALDFDFETMDAPKVLAKGMNLIAEEIKEQARWAGVPVLENPPLARSLYRMVEPGQSIPADLYAAVASILAYLYRQRVEERIRERRERERARQASARKADAGGAAAATTPAAVIPRSWGTGPSSRTAPRRGGGGRLDRSLPNTTGGKA
jgi:flagellar biosynthetic protein FlhB